MPKAQALPQLPRSHLGMSLNFGQLVARTRSNRGEAPQDAGGKVVVGAGLEFKPHLCLLPAMRPQTHTLTSLSLLRHSQCTSQKEMGIRDSTRDYSAQHRYLGV